MITTVTVILGLITGGLVGYSLCLWGMFKELADLKHDLDGYDEEIKQFREQLKELNK